MILTVNCTVFDKLILGTKIGAIQFKLTKRSKNEEQLPPSADKVVIYFSDVIARLKGARLLGDKHKFINSNTFVSIGDVCDQIHLIAGNSKNHSSVVIRIWDMLERHVNANNPGWLHDNNRKV